MTDRPFGASRLQRILVTGGCGYLGSRLVSDLMASEAFGGTSVRVLDNLRGPGPRVLMELALGEPIEFLEEDISDPVAVEAALEGVDAVVHLAAVGRTPIDFADAEAMEYVNHWGTARLVESCLEKGVDRLILASSASVYGPGGTWSEDDPCRPLGAFAQSKLDAERAVRVAAERGLRPTVLRLGTLVGPAPSVRFDTVANRFAYWAGIGRSLTVFGDGEQRRPFLHVADASSAVLFCLANPGSTVGRTFNVATRNASVIALVEALESALGGVEVRYTEQDVLTHLSYAVDISALAAVGWEPGHSVEEGLADLARGFSNVRALRLPGPMDDVEGRDGP